MVRTTRWFLLPLLVLAACGPLADGTDAVAGDPGGALRAALLGAGDADDVAGVLFQITCDGGFAASQYVPLETEPLPTWILPGAGDGHSFADLFQVVPVGTCTVTATPMQDADTPSALCQPATTQVTIQPGLTTEIVLVMNCESTPSGGLDVVGVINHGPGITGLVFGPSKFVGTCEPLEITVTAVDPDGDPLVYSWVLVSSPGGVAPLVFVQNGATLEFAANVPGDYVVQVTVTDPYGLQSTLTFPIHVSDDPSVDQCDKCCRLPDGTFADIYDLKCEAAGGTIVADELCRQVCCQVGFNIVTAPAGACQEAGGVEVSPDECKASCCKVGDQFLSGLSETECRKLGGSTLVSEACEPACCLDGGHYVVEPTGNCYLAGAPVLPVADCKDTCCQREGPTFAFVPWVECQADGGQPASEDLCKEICCKAFGGYHTLTVGDCAQASGSPVANELCIETGAWEASHTMGPGEPCRTPYLAVPSSAASALAVFDLATLLPLPGSPFPTCGDPSRILMDANTDVIATCRSGGHVRKHRKEGPVVWDVHLPNCTAARGIVIEPAGRLFAGCSSPNLVFELDPATGTVLGSADPFPGHLDVGRVYGLAADAEGLYVVDLDRHVSRLHLGGPTDLQADWVIDVPGTRGAYGLAVDNLGHVWTAGQQLTALDTATGLVAAAYPLTSYSNGVTVSPAGIVWVGMGSANQVARLDPSSATPTVTYHPLPAGDLHPRGVTADASDNLYTINMNSSNLTRFDPTLATTTFGGGGVLTAPYGYSGDMTGATFGCLLNRSEWWYGPVLDGGEVVQWLDVTWTALTPPGTSVQVSWSVDGVSWNAATSAQAILGAVGQFFQVRALMTTTNAAVPSLDTLQVRWQH